MPTGLRPTRGNDVSVADDVGVVPVGSGVYEVGPDRRPGRHSASADKVGFEKKAGSVTDRSDGLAGDAGRPYVRDNVVVGPQPIRRPAARHHNRIDLVQVALGRGLLVLSVFLAPSARDCAPASTPTTTTS